MNLESQKKIAAKVLKCSKKRIYFDPMFASDISEAITGDDIRSLVKQGMIYKIQKKGVSRVRANFVHNQKKKGRRRGQGNRKGRKFARFPRKQRWIIKVRNQRALVRYIELKKIIDRVLFRNLYRKVKGGFFRSRKHILIYLRDNGYEMNISEVLLNSRKVQKSILNKNLRKKLKV